MTERNYPPIFVENGYFHQKNKEKKFNKKKKFQQREEILGTRYNHKTWLPWKKNIDNGIQKVIPLNFHFP